MTKNLIAIETAARNLTAAKTLLQMGRTDEVGGYLDLARQAIDSLPAGSDLDSGYTTLLLNTELCRIDVSLAEALAECERMNAEAAWERRTEAANR